jgi:hypothetical protein
VRRSPGKQSSNDEAERAAEPLAFRDIHVRPPMFANSRYILLNMMDKGR